MCTVRGISNALRAKVRKFSRRHRITRVRSHITILKNKIQFHIPRTHTHTHTLASISSYLHTYINLLGYSILLINLHFLFYFNPCQMLLSPVCIDRNRCKIISKIFENSLKQNFSKVSQNMRRTFYIFSISRKVSNTSRFSLVRRASLPFSFVFAPNGN